MRAGALAALAFLAVFIALSLHQLWDFGKPRLETYGLREWRVSELVGFWDSEGRPLVKIIPTPEGYPSGAGLYRRPLEAYVVVKEGGYEVVDKARGIKILDAKFDGRDVLWWDFERREYVRVGFSPFLNVWPNKPKPILMLLALREPELEYLGFKPEGLSYEWRFHSTYLLSIEQRSVEVTDVGVTVLSSESREVTVRVGRIELYDVFEWLWAEYKGSLPLMLSVLVPVRFVNPEFLSALGLSAEELENVALVKFMRFPSIEPEELELRRAGGSGLLYATYPVLGGLAASAGVVASRWLRGRPSERS